MLDGADRVGQRGDLAQAGDHGVDTLIRERESIQRRCIEAIRTTGLKVAFVGLREFPAPVVQRPGDRLERGVAFRGPGTGHGARGRMRGGGDGRHVLVDVGCGDLGGRAHARLALRLRCNDTRGRQRGAPRPRGGECQF